jgi:N4-gp56 family major capsid protein
MADAYTGVGASLMDQTAFDLRAFYALRPELYFDAVASVQPTAQSFPGAAVKFTQVADLSAATTTLNESTDVDAAAMSDAQVTLTLAEYGNAVITTAKLRGTTFIDFDPVVANVIGFNAGISLDTIARDVLKAGTNVTYATGGSTTPTARNEVEASDTLAGDDTRLVLARLRAANVMPIGGAYVGYIHPDVSYDFRGATGGANWRDPHTYSAPEAIWNGEVGMFDGIRFIETPRSPVFADAGSSTTLTDVYGTLIVGQEALAKAHSYTDGNGPFPSVVQGPVVDKLRRNVPMGWYWLGTYGIFREACLRRIDSASSIGTNA